MLSIDKNKKYLLAVSGGSDSMAMLHMFFVAGANIEVATVNHHIRAEAAADAALVSEYCRALGIPCHVLDVDVPTYAAAHSLSTETAARVLRYEALATITADLIVTAHNADDNAESILMHILRGAGTSGAVGMKQYSERYFRPLLSCTKQQLTDYCTTHNIPYTVDVTNADTHYTRNFLRHEVLPLLKRINANAINNILRFGENAAVDEDYLNTAADISSVVFSEKPLSARIPKELLTQHPAVAARVALKVFRHLGVHHDIEKNHIDSLIALAGNFGGKKVSLPFDFTAINDYNSVYISRGGDSIPTAFCCPFVGERIETSVGVVTVSREQVDGALRFDSNAIVGGALLRNPRPDDTFTKFGGGTKKLTRYLMDKKVPRRQRDRLLVVANGNEVLIIIGVEISEKVRVNDGSDVCYIKLN
jgi:tRNA(Ile)-lysidine synthase